MFVYHGSWNYYELRENKLVPSYSYNVTRVFQYLNKTSPIEVFLEYLESFIGLLELMLANFSRKFTGEMT